MRADAEKAMTVRAVGTRGDGVRVGPESGWGMRAAGERRSGMRRGVRVGLVMALPLLLAGAGTAESGGGVATSPSSTGPRSAEAAYAAGTRAMNEQRWPDAIGDFDVVVGRGAKQADAALYWKAYCLNKVSRGRDTRVTCDALRVKFPESSWNRDCKALLVTGGGAGPGMAASPAVATETKGVAGEAAEGDADLKLLALNSLARESPERAVPLLRAMLEKNQAPSVRQHAIFALTQSRSPEATALLGDAVTGKMGLELQRQAIPMVAALGGSRVNDQMAEVYRTTADAGVKESVISAFFIQGDAGRLVAMARGEKDVRLKRSIVSKLALMKDKVAQDYMLELLQ